MDSLLELDRELLLHLNGSNSLFLDNLAVTLTSGLTWIPLYITLLYVIIKNNETMKQIMLTIGGVLVCIILSDGMADFIVKPMVERFRPSHEPAIKYIVDIVNGMRDTQYGFFSAHASNTFSIAVFFSLLIRSGKFTIAIVLWSLINCWTRMYLGLHYPGDILFGLLWGVVAGGITYYAYLRLYLSMSPKFNYISSLYSSTGYSLSDIDTTLAVLSVLFVYAIIKALVFI